MQDTALIAIEATPPGAYGAQLTVIRPLLDLPKPRLIATLEAAGLSWREDPSNDRDDFERVRMRKALGVLEGLGITSGAMARSASRLSRARSAVAIQAAEAAKRHTRWHEGAFGSIPLQALTSFRTKSRSAFDAPPRCLSGTAPDPGF